MKKFIEAMYDSTTKKVMVRNPKDMESWIPLENFDAMSSDMGAQCEPTTCVTEEYEVCQGYTIGPPPEYEQIGINCKKVTKTVCT